MSLFVMFISSILANSVSSVVEKIVEPRNFRLNSGELKAESSNSRQM